MKMRYLFLILLSPVFVMAQEKENADEIKKSFQNEYVYLASQKAALSEQKNKMVTSLNSRLATAKKQTADLQKQMAWLSADNDDKHEYMMSLEKKKKDLQKKDSSLESIFKKSHKNLEDFKAGLYFETSSAQAEMAIPEEIKFEDFEKVMESSKELLVASTQVESFPGAFVDMNDKLVDGIVTRIGRSAAIGSIGHEHFILGPNGSGPLKALEAAGDPMKSSLTLYVFESLSKISKIKKAAGFTEKLADLSPILFLGMMLMMVLGLFVAMMRI